MTDDSFKHAIWSTKRGGRAFGKAVIVLVLIGFGSCTGQPQPQAPSARSVPASTPSPMPKPVPPPQPEPLPSEPIAALAQLVDKIAALPELDKGAVERIVGVPLTHLANAAADERYYEATLPSGPFGRVEVRQSNPAQQTFALVILDARAGLALPLASLEASGRVRPGMTLDVNPDVPPEGITAFTDVRDQQKLHYQFTTNSRQLTSVVIERRGVR